jgi:hypothetical protein
MENIEKTINNFLEKKGYSLEYDFDDEKLDIMKKVYKFYQDNEITNNLELEEIGKSVTEKKMSTHIFISIYLLIESEMIESNSKDLNKFKKVIDDDDQELSKINIIEYLVKYLNFLENSIDTLEKKVEETKRDIERLKLMR